MHSIDNERLITIGYDSCAASCGRFMVLDHDILEKSSDIVGLHVIPLREAFQKFPHVKDRLFFNLVDADKNEFTRLAAGSEPVGYYVRVEEGVKIEEPMQAAFLFGGADPVQARPPAATRPVATSASPRHTWAGGRVSGIPCCTTGDIPWRSIQSARP